LPAIEVWCIHLAGWWSVDWFVGMHEAGEWLGGEKCNAVERCKGVTGLKGSVPLACGGP
jgi:hypothetical protein